MPIRQVESDVKGSETTKAVPRTLTAFTPKASTRRASPWIGTSSAHRSLTHYSQTLALAADSVA
eukprot:4472432-Pyramimonas_sp.AAC.1